MSYHEKAMESGSFYDKFKDVYDEIDFKKKKGAKNATGADIEAIVPSEGEVRLLGNRNR